MAAPHPSSELLVTPKTATKDEASCNAATPTKPTPVSPGEMRAVARKFADQPVQNPEDGVWAVLTAISKNARLRPEGMNILLSADEHYLGRIVQEASFRISCPQISAKHCKIYRDTVLGELNRNEPVPVFLKDTSSNGTFINWTKLKKTSPPTKLNHGDIISLVSAPHDNTSYAFVYREVNAVSCTDNEVTILKRKSDEIRSESKRLKGLGIGSLDGPVSLDDVRRLEKSNAELREQLEEHVVTIETLRTQIKISEVQHEKELKELKEIISSSYVDQAKSLQQTLEDKQKQIDSLSTSNTELQNSIKDLDERLDAYKQSRAEADEIIQSQKSNICELEAQLSEERNLRREERDKAAEDLKSALHKANAEAQEEINRQAEAYLRQQREQKEVISKLQESEKEIRLLVETLRSKLEDTRENLVTSEKKARELEAQLQDEQLVSSNNQKKAEKLETELRKVKKELEHEKAAREEAWAKVSALELEIAATIRDLSIEKQRYQGARERIILRETQLRAFYSTTEEISSLFAKQQEQLKAMQRTLEDEENYENTIMGDDLNKVPLATVTADNARVRVDYSKNTMEASGASTENAQASEQSSSGDDSKETEQQDDFTRVEGANTQECNSPETPTERFRSDSHGDHAATAPELEPTDTEQVPETESQAGNIGCRDQNSALQRFSDMGGDTMQLDDEMQPQENDETTLICNDGGQSQRNEEPSLALKGGIGHCSEQKHEVGCSENKHEDIQTRTIGTADLLASEVAGSWAVETGPSVNGENESPRSLGEATDHAGEQDENVRGVTAVDASVNSDGQAAGSQSNIDNVITKITDHHRILNAMIEIVDPDFRKQLPGSGVGKDDLMSDAETEEGSEAEDTSSDSEEVMVEDSVG
ncbi:myosin-11 isoform X2 [Oryza brachyantha]|uniref:FHA domain-containing protein n=1 Tax=Oryza brachyantha TaxID=4533 RepID=J3LJI8_ORYBR|nr:myosin-11 isoform X2 [Oryza brachyantha]